MKKYDVTLTGHYEKTLSVYANTAEQAAEKVKIVLFDTDLIDFFDDDFVCGEAVITDDSEDDCANDETESDDYDDDDCSGCAYYCPVCGCCMCGDED